jgi:hypothetical protein
MISPGELHSLWIGPRLGWLERLSVSSWLAHGHRAVLWTYHPIEGVPRGVDIRDARAILPESAITYHSFSGSVSLFSNRFRYHLFQRCSATWFDSDVFLLRPFINVSPYVYAWETAASICNAVLRLPAGSPALRDLLTFTDASVPVPRWWPLKSRVAQRARALVGRHARPQELEWGTFGPRALSEILRRRGLTGHALPRETFYPIIWTETAMLYAPREVVEARITPRTVGVHLWSTSSGIATPAVLTLRNRPSPPESWIGAQCTTYGIDRT